MSSIFDSGNPADLEPCCGCGICAAVCPIRAITMKMNSQGFFTPEQVPGKCNSCELCTRTCYRFINTHQDESSPLPHIEQGAIFSAFSNIPSIRQESSSGGVAPVLASVYLALGYRIGGVSYAADEQIARYCFADTPHDLVALSGSKYLQSFSANALREFLIDKKRRYVFFGLPCQIYGIRRLAKINNAIDRVLLVDLFCLGVPTYHLWHKYIAFLKSRGHIDEVVEPKFRDKRTGWHTFSITINGINKNYSVKKAKDLFFAFYLRKNCICDACYGCRMRRDSVASDIRLGDFWGPAYLHDNQGVSLVNIITDKGAAAWERVRSSITTLQQHTAKDMFISQPIDRIRCPDERFSVMKLLADPSIPLEKIASTYIVPPDPITVFLQRSSRALRRILRRLRP